MLLVRQIGRWFGTLLFALGLVMLFGTGVLFGYSQYEEWRQSQEAAKIQPIAAAVVTPTLAPATATPQPIPTRADVVNASDATTASDARDQALGISREEQLSEERQALFARQPTPTAVPTVAPTPIPIYPAERIVARSIGLDSKVVESPIVNGEWTVPKFVAGHLQGTGQPLQGGNVVLSGHVESISSGNVFSQIGKLKAGDEIQIYTQASIVSYVVDKLEVVPNTDVDVIKPGAEETLTLITCTGTWLPLQRDYDRRLVVIAGRVS